MKLGRVVRPRLILAGLIVGALLVFVQSAQAHEPHIYRFYAPIKGFINGAPIVGNGFLSADAQSGVNQGWAVFDMVPSGFTPLAVSCCSILCTLCGTMGQSSENAETVLELSGGEFYVKAEYEVFYEGAKVGHVFQTAWAELVGTTQDSVIIVGEIGLYGWYQGPTDLVGSAGYEMYLKQDGAGVVKGVYEHTIDRSDGTAVTSKVIRYYYYNTERALPFTEVSRTRILSASFETCGDQQGIARFLSHICCGRAPQEDDPCLGTE